MIGQEEAQLMQVKILLFGQLKELFNDTSLHVTLPVTPITVADLRTIITNSLSEADQTLATSLQVGKTFVAVNQTVAQETDTVSATDEIALFPPVTGG